MKALLVVVLLAGVARADDLRDAHGSIDKLEAYGARRPITPWTDNAWSEAARLAAAQGDLARERRDLEQVVAVGTDSQLVRRAQAELARIGSPQWDAVAAEHQRLESEAAVGDPKPALAGLEQLVRANPGYPQATAVRLAIARGWERDGNTANALRWYREAAASGDPTARIALVRGLVGAGELAAARTQLAGVTDAQIAAALEDDLATAEHRRQLRWLLAGVLALIVAALVALLRRDAGSWRAAGRALRRPPVEALYFAPIAIVLAAIASTGNPLVASAVRVIGAAGLAITWVSGASLEAARQHRTIRAVRAIGQGLLAAAAVGAVAYLVISGSQLIDMTVETMRHGPAPR